MKLQKLLSIVVLTVSLTVAGLVSTSQAQVNEDGGVSLRSIGVSVGSYSPSFDYFDRTFWDFSSGATFGAEAELYLINNIGVRGGVGYFNTSSDVTRGALQEETFEYSMIPIQLGVVGYFDLGGVATLSVSPGVDFNMINATYSSGAGDQDSSGMATTFNVGAGLEKAFGNIGVELYGKYVIGSFDQDLQFSSDSEVTTEEIALDGLSFGVALKYLF